MPLELVPLPEGTETLAPLAEGAESLAVLAEGAETLAALDEFATIPGYSLPAMYPSAVSYPSVAATFPSIGSTVATIFGLLLDALAEGAETLTPLPED